MKSLDGRNSIKIYNLSAGKSLPDWISDRKRRKLAKRDVDIQRRIELIQDFDMPDISNCIKVSPDSQYIIASGTYKPRMKCFEVSALSLKFERCFDSEVIEVEVLSEDYSKLVFLQEDRYVEFHNQGGRWYRTRIPKFGRDLAYHYPSCDLYIGASGNEVYRLNLQQGKFLNPLCIDSPSVNKCLFNPVHYLFTCGTEDGRIEAWDPRSRHRVGVLDCALHLINEHTHMPVYKSAKELGVTSLAVYNDGLTLAVGTQTGQILLYDIRMNKPTLVKDHMDGFPIIDLEFNPKNDIVYSMSTNALKMWDKNTGKPYTSIESDIKFNDLCVMPDSGMVFMATEDPKMQVYFIPSLGPAPKWCAHLDALVEELEEEDAPPAYDDYKFVTLPELRQLGLENLIGTNVLRAVMHGYYMDIRLYHKAKAAVAPMDHKAILKQKVKQKLAEENNKGTIQIKQTKSAPDVNPEPFKRLQEEARLGNKEKATIASDILEDSRFSAMFSKSEFEFDKESEAYNLIHPLAGKVENRFKQIDADTDEEVEAEDDVDMDADTDDEAEAPDDVDAVTDDEVEAADEVDADTDDELDDANNLDTDTEDDDDDQGLSTVPQDDVGAPSDEDSVMSEEEEPLSEEEEIMSEEEEPISEQEKSKEYPEGASPTPSEDLGQISAGGEPSLSEIAKQIKEQVQKISKNKNKRKPKKPRAKVVEDGFKSSESSGNLHKEYVLEKRLPLDERIKELEDDDNCVINEKAYGSREMKFTIGDNSSRKFDKLRQQQKEHHSERKELVRSTHKLKGRYRMNKPF